MRIPEEQNHNPAYRPTNEELSRWAVQFCVASAVLGAIIGAVLYVFIIRSMNDYPIGMFSIFYGIVGAVLGLAIFFPSHYAYGRRKRVQYRAAGGDDTGMTDWMLGAMGGHVTKEGQWEWHYPEGSGGDYV